MRGSSGTLKGALIWGPMLLPAGWTKAFAPQVWAKPQEGGAAVSKASQSARSPSQPPGHGHGPQSGASYANCSAWQTLMQERRATASRLPPPARLPRKLSFGECS